MVIRVLYFQHGLIAAESDQSTGILWSNDNNVATGATATGIGTGNANTNTIVSAPSSGSCAAQLCADLELNGYSDWYLPSKDELNELYENRVDIGDFTTTGVYYWSSSEDNGFAAYMQQFKTGSQYAFNKETPYYVRAIRAF